MKKSTLKRLLVILGILVVLFMIINIVWIVFIKVPHDRYARILKENAEGYDEMYHCYYEGSYSFNTASIRYLDFMEEIRVTVSNNGPVKISYEQTEDGTYIPAEQSDPMIAVRMYRSFWGVKRFVIDYWDMVNQVDFVCAVDEDLNILRIGEVDYGGDEMIDMMRGVIAENYDNMKAMYDYTYDLVGGV